MRECVRLRIRILGAYYPDTLSSSRAVTDWQIRGSGTDVAAATDLVW